MNNLSSNKSELISWDPKFATGIRLIDDEHKKLVELCKNLYNAILQNQSNENWHELMYATLKDCVDYVNVHFRHEEQLMKASKFDGYDVHRTHHMEFESKIAETVSNFNSLAIIDVLKFIKFLYEWILSHIAHEDKLYIPNLVEFLKANQSISL